MTANPLRTRVVHKVEFDHLDGYFYRVFDSWKRKHNSLLGCELPNCLHYYYDAIANKHFGKTTIVTPVEEAVLILRGEICAPEQ